MPLLGARLRPLFAVLFGVFVLYGVSMTIIGATLPRILADFHWDYVTAGAVIAAGAVAYFLSTFAAGWLVKHVGAKATLVLGFAFEIVGVGFFGTVGDPWINFALSFLIGVGQGCFEVALNWATLRVDTANSGRPMSVMHGAFAVGAIAGPFLLGFLTGIGSHWVVLYRLLAALFAVLAAVLLLMPMHLSAEPEPEAATPRVGLSARPAYWLSFVVLFLYVGVELGLSNWVAEYFSKTFRFDAASASLMVSVFWAGVLAGRFGVPALLRGVSPEALLKRFCVLATVAALALPAFNLVPGFEGLAWIAVVFVFLAGLGASIVYPSVMTLIGICFPRDQSRVVGFAATGGGVGAFLFPFAMAAMAQLWGLTWGFAAYGVFAVLMTVAAFALTAAARRQRG
jgi:fucose permease